MSDRVLALAAGRWSTLIAATALIGAVSFTSTSHASPNAPGRRLISAKGHTIEAFVFGAGSQTLIMAAGNGRPAAQLTDLAKSIASAGI